MTDTCRPSVSVVIPVRDDAAALAVCLERLARQTVRPVEIVVVDNASSDDSARVARGGGARVLTELRVGIPAAAARGYDAATGDLIVRCDADTVPGRRWIERLTAPLASDPALDAVTGIGRFHDLPRGCRHVAAAVYLGAYYAATHLALGHTSLWGSNMALRRSSWRRVRDAVHRADAEIHDDLDLAFALGPDSRIRLVPVAVGVSGGGAGGEVSEREEGGGGRQ
ncbi:glycosyltransferase family 2 protein [uncultured Aeromicrobium sp.]|uniref:glycosyltransferase family 2 protein n=1 Tax=uncultured Aeromicrobium sp. TaxID=337820 RepID=UPI0025CFC8AE|nr:glycosyltransferase family 2 protein [uncultured Aeromicrobium sp.]